jgi:TfoX/Sxy family transcriptional regulator of competence genes
MIYLYLHEGGTRRSAPMAYNEDLAARVRALLAEQADLSERKMFGGLAFMVQGNMCCGIVREELMVRVGPERYAAALTQPHAREIDFTGRPMTGMVMVAPDGLASDVELEEWVGQALAFASSLPPK